MRICNRLSCFDFSPLVGSSAAIITVLCGFSSLASASSAQLAAQPENLVVIEESCLQQYDTGTILPYTDGSGTHSGCSIYNSVTGNIPNPSGLSSGSTTHWDIHQGENQVVNEVGTLGVPFGPIPSALILTPSGSNPNGVSALGNGWVVQNDSGSIYSFTDPTYGPSYQLSQNGGVGISEWLSCGNEYDLFLATIDPVSVNPGHSNPNVIPFNSQGVSLLQAKSLKISFGYMLANENVIRA